MRRIDRQAFGGGSSNTSTSTSTTTRHFNTSRAHKAVNDSSTVDFAYLPTDYSNPDLPPYMTNNFANLTSESQPRIPTPPDAYSHNGSVGMSASTSSQAPAPPMKPQIHFIGDMADNNGPSPLSEVVDNDAAEIDPFRLTELVGEARRRSAAAVEEAVEAGAGVVAAAAAKKSEEGEGSGVVRELWGGFVDDVFGKKSDSRLN
jgi:hypothetical protein